MHEKPATPELALHLQSWLDRWPAEARGLWHDLARGRLAEVTYQTSDGRRYAGGSWPAWCYLPNPLVEHWLRFRGDLALPLFQDLAARHDGYLRGDQIGFVPMLAALLCRWRLGKGAYRIHPRMLEGLRDTELAPEIPVAALFHLPEWAVLVETPGFTFLGQPIGGFAAYLNSNYPLRLDPALVLHLFRPGPYAPGRFPAFTRSLLLAAETLGACYETSLAAMTASEVEQTGWRELLPFLSVLLYLCSANREIQGPEGRAFQPPVPRVQHTRQGVRAHPADRIHAWNVAWRVGAALEAAERREREPSAGTGASTGRSPKPHLRRAHWHLYWAGKGRAEPRLKWLPPIPVNVEGYEPVATVREVGQP